MNKTPPAQQEKPSQHKILEEFQGRAWGVIGFISQLGYVLAYALSGITADAVGSVTGGGVGRGASLTITFSGIGLSLIALMTVRVKRLYTLENSEVLISS